MGREIRRVPVNWQHPKEEKYDPFKGITVEQYIPLYDEDFETAIRKYLQEFEEWKSGEFERVRREYPEHGFTASQPWTAFAKWYGDPPTVESYRPAWLSDVELGFAIYETVSEGTPVTPAFATKQELIEYLTTRGTFWDDGQPWSREAAEGFVRAEYCVSMAITSDGRLIGPQDADMYRSEQAKIVEGK